MTEHEQGQRDDFSHEILRQDDELSERQQSTCFRKPEPSQGKQLLSLSHPQPSDMLPLLFARKHTFGINRVKADDMTQATRDTRSITSILLWSRAPNSAIKLNKHKEVNTQDTMGLNSCGKSTLLHRF